MLLENQLFANRYLLLNRLGQGAFSEVWRAEDTKVGNLTVALKVYAPYKGLDEDGVKVFGDEFAVVFNLHHQNLLTPSTFDEEGGSPYLVLPFCSQGSCVKLVGNMDERRVAQFLRDVSSALAYLHESTIVHQDIKPDNILVDDKGTFLVTDFGISTKIRTTLRKSVGMKGTAGTVAYMAPERFSKTPMPIMASDIWSFGATAFELMTGDVPFGDMGGGLQKNGAEIPDIQGNYSPALKTLVTRCLSEEPWNRPTAVTICSICENFLRTGVWNLSSLKNNLTGEKIFPKQDRDQTRRMATTPDFESPVEMRHNSPAPEFKEGIKTGKRNKLPLILAILVLLSAVGVTTTTILRKSRAKTDLSIVEVDSNDSIPADTITDVPQDITRIESSPKRLAKPIADKAATEKPTSKQDYATQNAQDASAVTHSNRTSTTQQPQTTPAQPKPDQSSMYHGKEGSGSGSGAGLGFGPGEGAGSGGGVGYGTGHRAMIKNIDATVNEEGQVCVEVHIAADGHVIDARVINNSRHKTTITNRNIQQQCVARAKQALYKPGKEELRIIVFN